MLGPRESGLWRLLAPALGAALLLASCGGSSGGGAKTPTAAPTTARTPVASTSPAGQECSGADAPPKLHSTTHKIEVATTTQTIEMAWDAPATLPRSYRYAFSQNPQSPPAQMETLDGNGKTANSGPLGQNRWYFYLVTVGDSGESKPVRCGPYVIVRGTPTTSGQGIGAGADMVNLTLGVTGGSSVEYFTNQGQRLFCGDTTLSRHDVTCSAEFIRGSEARIQRTLSLPIEEEARWRLAGWRGACQDIDADTEPRGGQCTLTMSEDKDVSVQFARRATLTITHTGPPQLFLRWGFDYRPTAQKGGGNPLTLRGEFDCDTDRLAQCKKNGYYDAGTTITLRAGTGVNAPNLSSFGGACATTESTCQFQLDADSEVSINWKY
jgi:hypothetical protein